MLYSDPDSDSSLHSHDMSRFTKYRNTGSPIACCLVTAGDTHRLLPAYRRSAAELPKFSCSAAFNTAKSNWRNPARLFGKRNRIGTGRQPVPGGQKRINFNLIYLLESGQGQKRKLCNLLESGTGRRPVPCLYNCSTIGYNRNAPGRFARAGCSRWGKLLLFL